MNEDALAVTARPAALGARLQLAGILAAVLLPMAAAYVMYHYHLAIPRDTVNQGTLVSPPLQISELGISDEHGEAWRFSRQPSQWRLVIAASQCGADCQYSLWLTRQVQTRLGKDSPRVERLLLLTEGELSPASRDLIEAQHKNLRVLDAAGFSAWAEGSVLTETLERGYFVVDPQGWAMMSYDAHQQGKHLYEDIKRLLKYSTEK